MQQARNMKKRTSQHTANQLGLQTIKAIVILMIFAGMTLYFASGATSALEESLSVYESPAELMATIKG